MLNGSCYATMRWRGWCVALSRRNEKNKLYIVSFFMLLSWCVCERIYVSASATGHNFDCSPHNNILYMALRVPNKTGLNIVSEMLVGRSEWSVRFFVGLLRYRAIVYLADGISF